MEHLFKGRYLKRKWVLYQKRKGNRIHIKTVMQLNELYNSHRAK